MGWSVACRGGRSRIVSQLKEEGYEMNVYEPCLFSKFAVREEPAVDGGSIAPGEFVGLLGGVAFLRLLGVVLPFLL